MQESLDQLLGIEGNGARVYFQSFGGMLKSNSTGGPGPDASPQAGGEEEATSTGHPEFRFDFRGRNRRPPRDPVNALLSLG